MILVDTSVWIDFFNGADTPERRTLHHLIEHDEDICLTGIVLAENLRGIRSDRDFQAVQEYLLSFPFFGPESPSTYLHAAQVYRDCRKKRRTIRSTLDCLIAAVCLENNLFILHRDRDYDVISQCTGLKVLKT